MKKLFLLICVLLISLSIGFYVKWMEWSDVRERVVGAEKVSWPTWEKTQKKSFQFWIPEYIPVPSYDGIKTHPPTISFKALQK